MKRVFAVALVAAALAAASGTATAATAATSTAATTATAVDGGGVELSLDGREWTNALSQPLFESTGPWVPGDGVTAEFWVRNAGPSAAELSVEPVISVGTGASRALAADLFIATRIGARRWHPKASSSVPGTGRVIVPADEEPIQVRVEYAPRAENRSQRARIGLNLTVRLTDSRAARGGPPPGRGAPLAYTGGLQLLRPGVALFASGVLLVAVAALMKRRRDAPTTRKT